MLCCLFCFLMTNIIKSAKFSLSDNLKIHYVVKTVRDCNALQYEWSAENGPELSIGKCKVMSFYRKRIPTLYAYGVGGVSFERVKEVKDLGVTFPLVC